ncbi:DUF262 domain-containing protein [Atlantibacter hermannii]|uniref:DUF262 domain-containing protein n=1 Tax=Atlantibacter hermannii TaxID=565 RepID=UPI0028A19F1C|nr:DUF262 domain-containing protein [Atlantibacter hermannii]
MNNLYNSNNNDYFGMVSSERGFQTKNISMSVSGIIEQINHDRLDLQLAIKHTNDWTVLKSSKLIESVLVGFPLQNIYCEENQYGNLLLLDGTQIINSLYRFHRGQFALKGLSIRKELNGKKIFDLDYRDYNLLMDRYLINMIIINYDSDNLLKYEFCKRVNSNNNNFPIQNARNYAYPEMKSAIRTLRERTYDIISFYDEHQGIRRNNVRIKQRAEIDQLFLFLFMLAFLQFKLINIHDQDLTISEVLDISANYYENNRQARGVEGYVYRKIRDMFQLIEYKNVALDMDFSSLSSYSSLKNNYKNILLEDSDYILNANSFIHMFYNYLLNEGISKRALIRLKNSSKKPNYLDVRASFHDTFEEI